MASIPEGRHQYRPVYVLGASLVLWFPSLRSFLGGGLGLEAAAIRYLVGAAVAWVGVTILLTLYTGYADGAGLPSPQASSSSSSEDDDAPKRRADD